MQEIQIFKLTRKEVIKTICKAYGIKEDEIIFTSLSSTGLRIRVK